jgi:hypothetical protein
VSYERARRDLQRPRRPLFRCRCGLRSSLCKCITPAIHTCAVHRFVHCTVAARPNMHEYMILHTRAPNVQYLQLLSCQNTYLTVHTVPRISSRRIASHPAPRTCCSAFLPCASAAEVLAAHRLCSGSPPTSAVGSAGRTAERGTRPFRSEEYCTYCKSRSQ